MGPAFKAIVVAQAESLLRFHTIDALRRATWPPDFTPESMPHLRQIATARQLSGSSGFLG